MKLIRKLLLILATIACSGTAFTQNYSFFEPNNKLIIRDVEYQNGKIYLLGTLSTKNYAIQVFNIENNQFEILFSNDDFNEQGLTDIKDMVFFENDLYVINDNKLINITKNFTDYSFEDEYNFKPYSDKYRQMHNITVRDNSLIIGSTSAKVLSRDTLSGLPVVHIEPFNELLKYENGKIERIIDERDSEFNFQFNLTPVLDNQNNLWFRENQTKPLKGGLIKISAENEVKVFDLKSYTDINYLIRPSSIDILDNLLYVGLFPRKETNYLEGLSIYDTDSKAWEYSIDFLENNDIYNGYSWEVPIKIKKLNNNSIAILGYEFTIQNDNEYLYFEITKTQKEKFGEVASYRNLDIYETENKYIIIRQNGVLVFEKSSITKVEDEYKSKYDYKIVNKSVEFESVINNYKIYNLLGEVVKNGENANTIDISNLIIGPYFINLNDEYIIKFIKD